MIRMNLMLLVLLQKNSKWLDFLFFSVGTLFLYAIITLLDKL